MNGKIWNEPNGHNTPENYAVLLISTSEVIKQLQPEAKIIGFALAGIKFEFCGGCLENSERKK